MFERRSGRQEQKEFWIERGAVKVPRTVGFYAKLAETLAEMDFARQRLGTESYQQVFEIVLRALRAHGLLRGRDLGIDSSVIEANASLRSLVQRNTEESYWEYVRRLAAQAGIDPQDAEAVRRFDKKRPGRRTSNKDWENPHDQDARSGQTKDGACDMIYKPEAVTDLESGAIVAAEVLPGDQADTQGLSERVGAAVATLHCLQDPEKDAAPVRSVTGDKGYFAASEITVLQDWNLRTIIGDRQAERRRRENYSQEEWKALRAAQRSVKSASGKALLKKRGMHLERCFEHVVDEGGLRRVTLRGKENLTKRYRFASACFNLSLLLRTLCGIGTATQWTVLAASLPLNALFAFIDGVLHSLRRLFFGHLKQPCSATRPSRFFAESALRKDVCFSTSVRL